VEKDATDLLLTDGAGGFLPGGPLGCLGMMGKVHIWRPRPLKGASPKTGRVGPGPRETDVTSLTHEFNARHSAGVPTLLGAEASKNPGALLGRSKAPGPLRGGACSNSRRIGIALAASDRCARRPSTPASKRRSEVPQGIEHRPAIPSDTRQSSIPILATRPLHRDARGVTHLDPDPIRPRSISAVDLLEDGILRTKPEACANTAGPSSAIRSLEMPASRSSDVSAVLRSRNGRFRQILAIVLDKVEGVERGSSSFA